MLPAILNLAHFSFSAK